MMFRRQVQAFKDRVAPDLFARIELAFKFEQGPPHGRQRGKLLVFNEIIEACRIERIVETGTNRGNAADWFAGFGLPVDTVEIGPNFYHYSRRRLAKYDNVNVVHGASVDLLRELAASDAVDRRVLFFLDAHWPSTPLAEEVSIIFNAFKEAVLFVDDFEVPDDPGYGFDVYDDIRLGHAYLAAETALPLKPHYPVMPSSEETGYRRGFGVYAIGDDMATALEAVPSLRTAAAA